MGSKRTVAVLLAGVGGVLIGWWLVRPVLFFLKPASVTSYYVSEIGEPFLNRFQFSVLFGIMLGLPPLLAFFFRQAGSGQPLRIVYLYAAGLAGAILAALYLKLLLIREIGLFQIIDQDVTSLQFPPLQWIPLAGTVTLVTAFLIVRLNQKPRSGKTVITPGAQPGAEVKGRMDPEGVEYTGDELNDR